jgi:hypothetical protein
VRGLGNHIARTLPSLLRERERDPATALHSPHRA